MNLRFKLWNNIKYDTSKNLEALTLGKCFLHQIIFQGLTGCHTPRSSFNSRQRFLTPKFFPRTNWLSYTEEFDLQGCYRGKWGNTYSSWYVSWSSDCELSSARCFHKRSIDFVEFNSSINILFCYSNSKLFCNCRELEILSLKHSSMVNTELKCSILRELDYNLSIIYCVLMSLRTRSLY